MYLPFRGTSATAWGASCRTGLESWTESAPTSFNSWTEFALNHEATPFLGREFVHGGDHRQGATHHEKEIVIGDFGPSPVAPLFMRF
jgi:hypothetical protein